MKNKKYRNVETVPNPIEKSVRETGKIDTHFGTGTTIKSGGVKLG